MEVNIIVDKKICIKCDIEKQLTSFRVRKDTSKGYDNICLICEKLYHKQNYKKNKEKIDKRNKEWAKNNPDKCRKLSKKYYYQDPEKYRKQGRSYWYKNRDKYLQRYQQNKDEVLKKSRLRYYNNIEYERKRSETYYEKNKDKDREYSKKHRRRDNDRDNERKKTDPGYRILCQVRQRMWECMKGKRNKNEIIELIGCSLNQLETHIQNKFKKGMAWDNHGLGDDKWHLDHIVPCRFFDFTNQISPQICFHYLNLQPLWSIENHKKQGKIPENALEMVYSIMNVLKNQVKK